MSEIGESNKRQKLNAGLLCDSTHNKNIVSFAKHLKGNIRYFELPDVKTGNAINNWALIGTDSEDVVICSDKVTYSIKKVEMSSDVYLLPASVDNKFDVTGSANNYYELRPTRGRLEKIDKMLDGAEYPFPSVKNPIFYTKNELRNQIQASEQEINDYCIKNNIICYDNKMRKLDQEAIWTVLKSFLDTCLELELDIYAIDEKSLVEQHMVGVDIVLLQHILGELSIRNVCESEHSENIWNLNPLEIYKACAHLLFREYYQESWKKPWPMRDFFLTWESRVPNYGKDVIFTPSLKLLEGIAITSTMRETQSGDSDINYGLIYIPVATLSNDPKQRLHQLYSCRNTKSNSLHPNPIVSSTTPAQFSFFELECYFKDIVGGTGQAKSVVELLLLHATLLDGVYYEK